MQTRPTLVYLMGAGRSGTTALATFLGGAPGIRVLGEMHQFSEHIQNGLSCSCGEPLTACPFWSAVLKRLDLSQRELDLQQAVEHHRAIPQGLLQGPRSRDFGDYLSAQRDIFEACFEVSGATALVDSAKYIGRALALRHLDDIDFKIIYLVRDVRGVTYSFGKHVQTPKTAVQALLYYLTINLTAEIARLFVLRGRVLKVRYEDMLEQPEQFFSRLETFLELDLSHVKQAISDDRPFAVGHLIGGNRLRQNATIRLHPDISWQRAYSPLKKVFLYLGALPIMLINRYRIL